MLKLHSPMITFSKPKQLSKIDFYIFKLDNDAIIKQVLPYRGDAESS